MDEASVEPSNNRQQKEVQLKLVTDTELLARFYGNEDELDHKEKFLRSYILNEGWKEKASSRQTKRVDQSDIRGAEPYQPLASRQEAMDEED